MNNKIAFAVAPRDLIWFAHVDSIKKAELNPTEDVGDSLSMDVRDAIDAAFESANMWGEEVEDSADGMSLEIRVRKLTTDDLIPFDEARDVLLKAGFVENEFYKSYVSA